jgi:hypothetical protein
MAAKSICPNPIWSKGFFEKGGPTIDILSTQ